MSRVRSGLGSGYGDQVFCIKVIQKLEMNSHFNSLSWNNAFQVLAQRTVIIWVFVDFHRCFGIFAARTATPNSFNQAIKIKS